MNDKRIFIKKKRREEISEKEKERYVSKPIARQKVKKKRRKRDNEDDDEREVLDPGLGAQTKHEITLNKTREGTCPTNRDDFFLCLFFE